MYGDLLVFLGKAGLVREFAQYVARKGDAASSDERYWLNAQYCLLREAWDDVGIDTPMPAQFWDLA